MKLEADGREIAVPIEDLCDPDAAPRPADPLRGLDPEIIRAPEKGDSPPARRRCRKPKAAGQNNSAPPKARRNLRGPGPSPQRPERKGVAAAVSPMVAMGADGAPRED